MQALILFSCLLAVASAWNCPNLPVVEQLNVTAALVKEDQQSEFECTTFSIHKMAAIQSRWYQQSLAGVAFFTQPGGSCTKDLFTPSSSENKAFTFKNSQNVLFQTVEVDGWATWADPTNQNGKLVMTVPVVFFEQSADLWVLDTDYENYAILYTCEKVLGLPAQASWILRRVQNPQGIVKDELQKLIQKAFVNIEAAGGPDLVDFVNTDQSHCW